MALKDKANLVKMYAMVNVEQYQLVATGTTFEECEREYIKLLESKNIVETEEIQKLVVEGNVVDIRTAVKEGTSYYYLKLDSSSNYYAVSTVQYEPVVMLNIGDSIKIEYGEMISEGMYRVEIIES